MVDFIKIGLSFKYASILLENNSCITWEGGYSYNTGEIFNLPLKGRFYNFDIIIKKSKIIISGSLHIYYNLIKGLEGQNYNDFSVNNMQEAVSSFSQQLKIPANQMKLENVELGVNIPLTINVSHTLKYLFIDWDTRTKCVDRVYKNGHLVEFKTSETYVKFYDKGGQYNLPYNLLRVEIKFMRNEVLRKKANISSLYDLCNNTKQMALIGFFKYQISKINIVDNLVPLTSLTPSERTLFENGTNPLFWSNYEEGRLKTQKSKYRIKYFTLIKKLGLQTISSEIIAAYKNKIDDLFA